MGRKPRVVKQRKMVTVRFTPQAWIRDYATEVDPQGRRDFRVPVADAQDSDGQWFRDNSYESDQLKDHINAPSWIQDWPGPFSIEILHNDGLQPRRVRREELLDSGADQLEDWASQLETEPVLRHLPLVRGIVAGMREVAADYRRAMGG